VKLEVKCDFCGNEFIRKERYVNMHKHHFCCKKCFFEFRKEHPETCKPPESSTMLNKIKRFAQMKLEFDRRQRKTRIEGIANEKN